MKNPTLKNALAGSLAAEMQAVKKAAPVLERFEQADSFFEEKSAVAAVIPEVQPETKPLVRDSFTLPVEDHQLIQKTMNRCLKQGVSVNKSETLRAALRLLDSLSEEALLEAVSGIEKVKTGRRPKNSKD